MRQYGRRVCGGACVPSGARQVAHAGRDRRRGARMHLNGGPCRGAAGTPGMLGRPVAPNAAGMRASGHATPARRPRLEPAAAVRPAADRLGARGGWRHGNAPPPRDHRRQGPALDTHPDGPCREHRGMRSPPPHVRRGMRLAGRNPDALASGALPSIRKACKGAYRAPGLARTADQGRRMRLNGDRSNSSKPEGLGGAVSDRIGTMGSMTRPDSSATGRIRSAAAHGRAWDWAASLPAAGSGWQQGGGGRQAGGHGPKRRKTAHGKARGKRKSPCQAGAAQQAKALGAEMTEKTQVTASARGLGRHWGDSSAPAACAAAGGLAAPDHVPSLAPASNTACLYAARVAHV